MNNSVIPSGKIFIIGAGGLGKEVLCCLMEQRKWQGSSDEIKFVEENAFYSKRKVLDIDVIRFSEMDTFGSLVVLAIGEPEARLRITTQLPANTEYLIVIDPSVSLTPHTKLGPGSIVLAQCFLSCDVEVGNHAVINPATTISHDCKIGDFFTTGPGVNISGNCQIGNRVFLGTNSCVRNAISICDDVIIGLGAVVTKDINIKGKYIGNPAKSII